MRLNLLLVSLAATLSMAAPSVEKRGTIGHDKVQGFKESVQDGAVGKASGGLKDAGAPNGKCSKNTGQVYARGAQHGNEYAIMYSWYMPKDQLGPGTGHRHDWEGIVVWLDDVQASSPKVQGVSTSAHGKWRRDNEPPLDGSRPKIAYYLDGITHSVNTTGVKGGEQPLIDWETMGVQAREALRHTDFGDAIVPFKDDKFEGNLDKAQ
ncbi:hypothetical protein PG991_008691 [Apiospora marii]|uniref:Uncharacterized protein n=1 Tax=Apiospora marii TaxID=335849 RepID=A0ABR1RLH5_9PEZI